MKGHAVGILFNTNKIDLPEQFDIPSVFLFPILRGAYFGNRIARRGNIV